MIKGIIALFASGTILNPLQVEYRPASRQHYRWRPRKSGRQSLQRTYLPSRIAIAPMLQLSPIWI